MAIIALEEIKELLGLTDNTRDNFIENNLPAAESFLFSEFHNYFEVATDQIYLEAETISFQSGTPAKILDSANGLKNAGFKDGMTFRIKGSYLNDGVMPIETVTAGELILKSGSKLTDEDYGLNIRLTIVRLPQEAKLFVAKYLEFHFPNKSTTQGIESEKFDDYSVKFKDTSEIPSSIIEIMNPKRKLSWA